MPGNEPLEDRLVDRRRIVGVADAEVAGAGVAWPGHIPGLRQGDERVMLPHRHCLGTRRDVPDEAARVVTQEGEGRLDLGVPGKTPSPFEVERPPRRIETEGALPGPAHRADQVVRVPGHEIGGVDQHRTVRLGLDLETPQH